MTLMLYKHPFHRRASRFCAIILASVLLLPACSQLTRTAEPIRLEVASLTAPLENEPFTLAVSLEAVGPVNEVLAERVSLRIGDIDLTPRVRAAVESGRVRRSDDGARLTIFVDDVSLEAGSYVAATELTLSGGDFLRVQSEVDVRPDRPILGVARIFARFEGDATVSLSAASPGSRVRALVEYPENATGDEVLAFFRPEGGEFVGMDASIEEFEIPGDFRSVLFQIPADAAPGLADVRFEIDGVSSSAVPIEIAESGETRARLAAAVEEDLGDILLGLRLVAPFSPLPAGSRLANGLTGDVVRAIERPDQWLFFAFDPTADFAQHDAWWILIDSTGGRLETIEEQEAWPEVIDPSGKRIVADLGETSVLYGQAFNAGQAARRMALEQVTAAPAEIRRNTYTGDGKSFTGRVTGPCPNGVRTIGLVLQLDDKSGFTWMAGEILKFYRQSGFNEAYHLNTSNFDDPHNPGQVDLDALGNLLHQVLSSIEDCCAELVITVISHGGRGGRLFFRQRGEQRVLATVDLTKTITGALQDTGKTCIPVSLIVHACYAASARRAIEDYLKGAFPPPPTPTPPGTPPPLDFGVIGSSCGDEVSGGSWDGDTASRVPDIFFLSALKECMELDRNGDGRPDLDRDGNGRVTLEEAWRCVRARTNGKSRTKAGRGQIPKRF